MPPKVPRKPKLLRSNPHHVLAVIIDDDDDDDTDDNELMPLYRRKNEIKSIIDNTKISNYALLRLRLIREKTLQKHREIMYNQVT
jgi:hypothetical protein